MSSACSHHSHDGGEVGDHVCGASGGNALAQGLDELAFERGLWLPAQHNNTDRLRTLLAKGASVDAPDPYGYTALVRGCNDHVVR